MTEAANQGPVSPVGLSILLRKKRWRSFLLGALILVCGIAIGTGGTVIVMKHIIISACRHPENVPQRITDRMRGKLGLTDDQAAKVKTILTERQKKIQALLRQIQPEVDKQFQNAKEEVAAVLKPDQAKKWRARFDRLRIWFPAAHANRGDSGG